MTSLQLAPSILTADFARLGDEIDSVAPHIDWLHLDVMDGHYVENITFGPDVVAAIRRRVSIPLHVHLMIDEPGRYAGRFVEAGASRISFHPEVVDDPAAVIEGIRAAGAGAGMAVHPDVGLEAAAAHLADLDVVLVMTVRPGFGGQSFLAEVVPKIREARAMVQRSAAAADIEVDGGVKPTNLDTVVEAGANIIVAGSAVFDGVDAASAAATMKDLLRRLEQRRE